ncbi:MAG: S8 family peptidase [Fimbriimonas sp.]
MILIAAALSLSATAAYEPITVDGTLCHPRNLLVKLADDQAETSIEASGAVILKSFKEIDWAVIQVPAGKLQTIRKQLSHAPGIEACTLDRAAIPAYTPNDPKWTDEWHMRQIKADLAWDVTVGTGGPIVAVIDTGVSITHEDLARNIFKNRNEIPGNGIDDDANGYVDDYNGYDFAYGDASPNDVYGHGTGCAGLVAAVGDNSIGISGVAPKARIMPIKAAIDSGYFYDSATVPAYIYAANMGARVFSMSYYSDRVSQAEEDALRYAYSKGVLPVAAAGNDASVLPYYPAGYDFVLSVAASTGDNSKAGFSNYGWWVDVAAPGVSLTTTSAGGAYMGFAGTSGACPHVAGLAALLKGASPLINKTTLRNAIEDTATLLSWDYSSHGLINAQAAMDVVTSGTPAESHAAKVNFISPVGYVKLGTGPIARVYGRNLSGAKVKIGGVDAQMAGTSRDSAYFKIGENTGLITVESATGELLATFWPPESKKPVWPLNEASSPGASVTGGFAEALRVDGQVVNCTRRDDGLVYLQMSFRRMPTSGPVKLVINRAYSGGSAGNESVQLYNWSTASYPYGSFAELSAVALPASTDDLLISIPDIAPYVDFEGTAYLRILTSDVPSGAELNLDACYFRK